MKTQTLLLFFMCISYCIPIMYVYSNYYSNNSVSNIICNENIKPIILYSMSVMAIFTLCYEFLRKNIISLFLMLMLIIGIYGVILIPEYNPVHYVFAVLCFISILSFMMYYCCILHNYVLYIITSLILWVSLWIGVTFYDNIFYGESSFLILFAMFYLYLHTLQS